MKNIFSIIIPIYKVEKYVAQCLESVITQSFKNFEVLCVDDCGGDNSIKIVTKYANKDNRIKVLHHKKNMGLSVARNTALDAANGEFIVCLDSDDWLEPNCLEVLYKEFNEKQTESIWFDVWQYDDFIQARQEEPLLRNQAGFLEITPQNICDFSDYSWIKAYRTSSIKKHNLYWPEGLIFEDGEFYFKYFTYNPKTYIIEDCLYNYRAREGSIVQNAKCGNTKFEDIYQVVKNIRQFYIELGLYDKYKCAVLQLLNMRINNCKNICNNYQKFLQASKEILEEFNFPEDFESFKSIDNS